jgi:Di-haem oxidoreductase, putative peroxidase
MTKSMAFSYLPLLVAITAAATAGCSAGGSEGDDENEPVGSAAQAATNLGATDPGVRGGVAGAGAPQAAQPINQDAPAQVALDGGTAADKTETAKAAEACFPGLGSAVQLFCEQAVIRFQEIDSIAGAQVSTGLTGFIAAGTTESGTGLGPTFNANGCAVCHAQPSVLGAGISMGSPQLPNVPNPQVGLAHLDKATNAEALSFITASGPTREVRFTTDNGVHDLFTVSGREDVPTSCTSTQPPFATAMAAGEVSFRIPIATFGDGLVELIPESALMANLALETCGSPTIAAAAISAGAIGTSSAGTLIGATATTSTGTTTTTAGGAAAGSASNGGTVITTPVLTLDGTTPTLSVATTLPTKSSLGIAGSFNLSGNDGTITRFGWKAQNKSLFIFAMEAYNVEQGVTNEGFPNERTGGATLSSSCLSLNSTPEDDINFAGFGLDTCSDDLADVSNFAQAMALSKPAVAALPKTTAGTTATLSEVFEGFSSFINVGCAHCHTPSFTTGTSNTDPALSGVSFSPFSDFAIHNMGPGLADGITQGNAGPQQFRTAPLWGVGQRQFFLHDGRTNDLTAAIAAHAAPNPSATVTAGASEATVVINNFNTMLTEAQQQDVIYFLRSL